MKNFWLTLIVGFVTGLIISGVLADAVLYVGRSVNRISAARLISKAEKSFAEEKFADAVFLYEKALTKIDAKNKVLYAKTKNNMALSVYRKAELEKDGDGFEKALDLLRQAREIYAQTGDKKLYDETDRNIGVLTRTAVNATQRPS